MRAAILGVVAVLGFSHGALADASDPPYLRGSNAYDFEFSGYKRWAGVYGGVHGGYSSATMNFGHSAKSLLGFIDRNSILNGEVPDWTVLGSNNPAGTLWGGFVGYNWQWDAVVLGLEVNYSRGSLAGGTSGGMSRILTLSDQYTYTITASAASTVRITDVATIRARAGQAMGAWLPYATVGFAVGRADITRSASNSYPPPTDASGAAPPRPNLPAFAGSDSEGKNGAFAYGISAGAGVDFEVVPGVLLRAEYEHVRFLPLDGVNVVINTVRAGAGVKF